MMEGKTVFAVIPAFNEARFIAGVVRAMPAFVDGIIVVDDCSTDTTADEASSTGDPRLEVLRSSRNRGVGGSVVAGYEEALRRGADVVVKVDGDGQMAPEYIERLVSAVVDGGYQYAKGNRFLSGEILQQMPAVRILGNTALTFLNKAASGYWHIFDPQNGFTAIQAGALKRLPPSSPALAVLFRERHAGSSQCHGNAGHRRGHSGAVWG